MVSIYVVLSTNILFLPCRKDLFMTVSLFLVERRSNCHA